MILLTYITEVAHIYSLGTPLVQDTHFTSPSSAFHANHKAREIELALIIAALVIR